LRVAVSGSHGTGKSTLIADFLRERPGYRHEPEAFELLGDEIDIGDSGEPAEDGLALLLEHTLRVVETQEAGSRVVFERSPVDYLAYAVAARSWPRGLGPRFVRRFASRVRESLSHLDLIVLLPLSTGGPVAHGEENPRFRRRVDEALRGALLDDDLELLQGVRIPTVVELPVVPDRRLAVLLELTKPGHVSAS
jgi:hypothetical protein